VRPRGGSGGQAERPGRSPDAELIRSDERLEPFHGDEMLEPVCTDEMLERTVLAVSIDRIEGAKPVDGFRRSGRRLRGRYGVRGDQRGCRTSVHTTRSRVGVRMVEDVKGALAIPDRQ
jgi:hypothetical protein